jgi:hypothetical protein
VLAVVLATGLVVGATLRPVAAPTAIAAAASPLAFEAASTYTVDPEDGAVHVVVDWKITDKKRNDATHIYYFDHLGVVAQPEATNIKVSDSTGPLKFATKHVPSREEGEFIYFPGLNLTFALRRDLFYGQTARIKVTYDLAGVPRSSSPVRVGQAFAQFPVWAFGDDGHASVKVVVPKGFDVRMDNARLEQKTDAEGGTVLTAAPKDSLAFWSLITLGNESAYAKRTLSLGGGLDVVLESFPEDAEWADTAADVIRRGGPALRDLVGVDPAGDGPIRVRERYELDLDWVQRIGFAPQPVWSSDPSLGRRAIALDESTDEGAILRQFAAAWFSDDLFASRWIRAGLASEYGSRAAASLGGTAAEPEAPAADAAGRQPLELWAFPRFPVGPDYRTAVPPVAERERYGQTASWYVANQLVEKAGLERMREVIARAASEQVAYAGAGAPETTTATADWRRMLDLIQEVGGVEEAESLFRDLVLTSLQTARLDERAAARDSYHGLELDARGWLPPWYVRKPMDAWLFEDAQGRVGEARNALTVRRQVEEKASASGLTPGPALKAAYETAVNGFIDFNDAANASLSALAALAQARADLDAPRDLFTQIGLYGERPEDGYTKAVSAFEADDAAAAQAAAQTVSGAMAVAPDVGRQRVMYAAGGLAAVVMLILLAVIVWRRRRRPPLAATAPASESVEPDRLEGVV